MLTADLVRARKVDGELHLSPLSPKVRARALELAELFLHMAREHVGKTREELDEAFAQLQFTPSEKRVAEGLRKLLEDESVFDAPAEDEPEAIRREVFQLASAQRQAATAERPFDREAVLAEVARARGVAPADLERALYADLRGANVLTAAPVLMPQHLLDRYDEAQAQGVLLRAVRVGVEVICHSAAGYRHLFRKIKFLRLLCSIRPLEVGYRIEIDGPFSLFESTTKYGLQLALLLPHLRQCDEFRLEAEVRWGKERERLAFHLEGGAQPKGPRPRAGGKARKEQGAPGPETAAAAPVAPEDDLQHLPEEVALLVQRFRGLQTPWQVVPSPEVLNLPGVGLCVPDLLFAHKGTGEAVYLEVLGFWSREAVWRRVELVEQGLPYKILFAVSERLRVSEQALGDNLPGMLYVYKGTMNARALADKLDRLSRGGTG